MTQLKITALADGIAQILIYGDIEERWWVDEQVNDAQDIINQLNTITASKIHVRIKSNGGNLVEALAMRNLLAERAKTTEMTFYLDGLVASAATVIPMIAGAKTIMASNALFMVHAPATEWSTGRGTAIDHQQTADILNKYAEAWAQNISEKTGKSVADILPILTDNVDHYFSAQEAIEYGFIDEIGESIQVTASALPPNKKLPKSWLKANKITATYQPEKLTMPEAIKKQAEAEAEKTEKESVEAKAKQTTTPQLEAAAIEAKRKDAIKAVFADVPESQIAIHAMMPRMLVDASINEAEARKQILAKMGEGQEPVARHHHVQWGSDGNDQFKADAVEAMLIRAGLGDKNPNNQLTHWNAMRLAEECAIRSGASAKTESQIIQASMQTSSDFAVLFESALNKTLLGQYAIQSDTWRKFCTIVSVPDFRPANFYRTGSLGNLDALLENGEIKHKAIPDGEKATIQIGTFANILALTRQAIINDDLGALLRLAQDFGRSAARTIESNVYAYLTSNPVIDDGFALFDVTHGNIGTAANVTVAAVDETIQLMSAQKDISGNDYLDLMPSVWVGGAANRANAMSVNDALYDPDTANKLQKPNIVKGTYSDIVATQRVAGNKWYSFANPSIAPVLAVGFLNGKSEPELVMENSFSKDGVAWRITLDFGVKAIDYRGAVYNAGA